jgi:hypothetical protein
MATYKVLQDIESEDKLVGPLSFRQCVYAAVAIMCFYFCFLAITKHAAVLLALFLPPALFGVLFAVPWQSHQTTEVLVLAKIRFFFKPRRRIWDQSGVRELVTITAPKRVEINYTNGLSQDEVKSRLSALANTIDSRGWVIKNVTADVYAKPQFLQADESSDRLVGIDTYAQPMADQPAIDMLDEQSGPIAQQFDTMINASRQAQRQQIREEMALAAQPAAIAAAQQQPAADNYWFMNPAPVNDMPTATVTPGSVAPQVAAAVPTPAVDEAAFVQQLKAQTSAQRQAYGHMRTLNPGGTNTPVTAASVAPVQPANPPVTPKVDPAILNLANNNDLNVATIARQANEHLQDLADEAGEVVVNLR